MPPGTSLSWDTYVVNAVVVDPDGFVRVQPDSYGETGGDAIEVLQPLGLHVVPRDPDVDSTGVIKAGCPMLVAYDGGKQMATLKQDARTVPKLPRGKQGSATLSCDTGKASIPYISFDGDTGSCTLYVPNAAGNRAHAISLNVDNDGDARIQIIHSSGANISMLADGTTNVISPNKSNSATVGDDGIVLNGNTSIQGAVLMGNPSAAQPVALSPGLLAYLSSLETAIQAVATAVPGGVAGTAFAAAVTALQALKVPISATLTSGA